MSKNIKWMIGILVGLIVLFALPFVWQAFFPAYGYGMMGYRQIPMMGGFGYGMMTPVGGFFMWLIPLGLLALIILGIAALVKYLTNKPDTNK